MALDSYDLMRALHPISIRLGRHSDSNAQHAILGYVVGSHQGVTFQELRGMGFGWFSTYRDLANLEAEGYIERSIKPSWTGSRNHFHEGKYMIMGRILAELGSSKRSTSREEIARKIKTPKERMDKILENMIERGEVAKERKPDGSVVYSLPESSSSEAFA